MAIEGLRRLELWARLGYVARGLVYLFLGWVALTAGRSLSTDDAVAEVERLPLAPLLLALLAAGLFGYALFKLYAAAIDLDHKGDDAKGRAKRIGSGLAGLAYVGLGWFAVKVLFGDDAGSVAGRPGGSSGLPQDAAAGVEAVPGGNLLLLLAAGVIIAIAMGQFAIAFTASFMKELPRCPTLIRPIGRLGFAARALVIGMVGWFLLRAALGGTRVHGFGDALAVLRTSNDKLFNIVAAGLMAFGLVSLLMAYYRRIEDRDVVDDLERGVEKVEQAAASVKS